MPYAPTTPPSVALPGPTVNKDLNVFHIHRVDVVLDPNGVEPIQVTIHWSKGYMQDGKYVAAQPFYNTLSGADVIAVYETTTSGSKDLYTEIKDAVWKLLKDRDIIPAGTVS